MEWLNDATAARLIEILGKLRKYLYDDPVIGSVVRRHNLNVLYTRVCIAKTCKTSNYLVEMSKDFMVIAADINELGLRGEVCLGTVKISDLLATSFEDVQDLIVQEQVADLAREICLLLATKYLNQALVIKVQEENRQFGGH